MRTSSLREAIDGLRGLSDESAIAVGVELLKVTATIKRVDRKLARLRNAVSDRQVLDILAELKFATCFAALSFDVEFEPSGDRGADFQVSRNGRAALVEVTRFTKVNPGPPIFSGDETELAEYGNVARDVAKARGKILGKLRQVGRDTSIIAIWNDDGDMEDSHVLTAVAMIGDDLVAGLGQIPCGLIFILYGSQWIRLSDSQQLYCFPIPGGRATEYREWIRELESTTIPEALMRARTRLRPADA